MAEMEAKMAEMMEKMAAKDVEMAAKDVENEALKAKSKVATNSGQGGASRKNLVNSATAIYDRDSKRILKGIEMDDLEEILHTVEFKDFTVGGQENITATSIWHLQYSPTYKTWEVVDSSGTSPIPMLKENHKSLCAIATAHQLRCYEAGHKELCQVKCTKVPTDKKILETLRIAGKPVPKIGDMWDCYGTVKAGKANPKIAWTFVGKGWGSDAPNYSIPDSESESDLEVEDVEEE